MLPEGVLSIAIRADFWQPHVRAEWLQSLSSIKTVSRCIKMMISFNDTIIIRSKSMYISFCESYRSLDHRSTPQPPYQLSASSHYTSSLSVTSICPSRLPPRTVFYSAHRTCPCMSAPRGQVHALARLTSITRRRSAS